jgi:preprotein translocase subunit SecG
MTFLIVLLTIFLVLNCLLLMLLVLIQLPKKEAGAGLAFGGGATDALFGAGSGNVLTQITKWSAGFFFGLALILSVLNSHANRSGSALSRELAKPAPVSTTTAPTPATPTAPSAPVTPTPNAEQAIPLLAVPATNAAAPTSNAATNAPVAPAK